MKNPKHLIEVYSSEKFLTKIVEDLNSQAHTIDWYILQIVNFLPNVNVTFDNNETARFTFLYLIQNCFKLDAEADIDQQELLDKSRQEAVDFITKNPYVFAKPESEENTTKRSGPSKKERAAAIYTANITEGRSAVVNAFMAELEMTKSGAGTYYNNFKSKKWELN